MFFIPQECGDLTVAFLCWPGFVLNRRESQWGGGSGPGPSGLPLPPHQPPWLEASTFYHNELNVELRLELRCQPTGEPRRAEQGSGAFPETEDLPSAGLSLAGWGVLSKSSHHFRLQSPSSVRQRARCPVVRCLGKSAPSLRLPFLRPLILTGQVLMVVFGHVQGIGTKDGTPSVALG